MSTLREAIAAALHATFPGDYHEPDAAECRPCQERTTAVMAVIEPFVTNRQRAEQAEAERERLRATALDLVTSVQAERDELLAERDRLARLVDEALVIRMYGERAPGGTENWADWDRKAEAERRGARGHLGDDEAETTEQIWAERDQLKAAIDRVKALAERWRYTPERRRAARELLAELDRPADQEGTPT